jgi:hypothetical protein
MELAEYIDEFEESVIDLLSKGKDSAYLKTKKKMWDWQYNQIPFASNLRKNLVIIEGEKIVGFTGFTPVMLKYEGNVIEAHWSDSAILDPICRGKGWGKKMYNFGKTISKVALGFGITDVAAHIMRKEGYKVNSEIEHYFYNFKSNNIKNIIKKIYQYMIMAKNFTLRPKLDHLNVRTMDTSNIPKRIDLLWKNIQDGYSKTVIKNYSYIKWKYGEFPLAKYHLILIEKGNELVGVGVFRKNIDISVLVDYVGPSKDIQIKYLIVKTFKKICSQSMALSCICTDNELKSVLEMLGFIRYKCRPRFYVYSNIENDRNPESNWFIMTGDSDGDFSEVQNI